MTKVKKLSKGLSINLKGKSEKIFVKANAAEKYAVKPTDFHGIVPKLTVKVGDAVKVGSSLFFDKNNPDVIFTSPVSGTISEINRGERRKILEVIIDAVQKQDFIEFEKGNPADFTTEKVKENILKSGLWPALKQRPFDIIANPADTPKAIFISAFDTNPLAPDLDFMVQECEKEFQAGIDALKKLTDGTIHLGINSNYPPAPVFNKVNGVQKNEFSGKHPTGNVGVQIHHTEPINKGELVWVIDPMHVITIGRLFIEGVFNPEKRIALAGSEVKNPKYYKTNFGTSIAPIIADNITSENVRFISGTVLTGTRVENDGYIGFYDNMITVIPEGNYFELFGWGTPGFGKFSFSRSFWSWLTPSKEFKVDTNLHGGVRALMITGKFEQVFPMDIYPMQLIKACIIKDIDLMEKLGIYEVAPEDFALCEFIDTSKTEIQTIIREGLDLMIKELS